MADDAEHARLASDRSRLAADQEPQPRWKLWGTYLTDRQWGTVREDYSNSQDGVWSYFPHDAARSRVYRWGEDGLLGWTDEHSRLCFAPALWNGADRILKERLFGLSGPEGNHGEDVKELYFHQDATPTHSYCKALYRYPQAAYPYPRLIEENARRDRTQREFELLDTGLFDHGRFFDLTVEYAKASPTDTLIRLTVVNHGPEAAPLDLLPTLWFRNTWIWGEIEEECIEEPAISIGDGRLLADHRDLGRYQLAVDQTPTAMLFTNNETNTERLFQTPNQQPYVKDAFHAAVIDGRTDAVNPAQIGTKAAFHFHFEIPAGGQVQLRLRLAREEESSTASFSGFDDLFATRIGEANAFYANRIGSELSAAACHVARSAYAGLLWSKQCYNLVQMRWTEGDPTQIAPGPEHDRNADWQHLYVRDVLSVPDKWEFPYFCSWDSAFHCVSLANIDPGIAKFQLLLFLRDWYMHRNGQLPAYEFNFSDVNPPVHPWAVWRVYRLPPIGQEPDRAFLERAFQKMLLNFTWWVNREDAAGHNLFGGGFLGLDNIGVFDRSKPLPMGGQMVQADGTAWMAFYCTHMLSMSLELARENGAYEDMASKFIEHYGAIASAMNHFGTSGLWDDQDGFYYDHLELGGRRDPLRVRSIVGFVPMLANTIIRQESVHQFSHFVRRVEWNLHYRGDTTHELIETDGESGDALLSIPSRQQLERMCLRLFDENEFLSPYGIRSLSLYHRDHPYTYYAEGRSWTVNYEPGEGTTGMFGGNSNWRGPIWFPINYLILESLRVYHRFYGNRFLVEFPTGSGNRITLGDAAHRLSERLQKIFLPDENGRRPCHGDEKRYAEDPVWKDLLLFNEYFHADTGRGCGASHQTGWTALIADLMNLEAYW